MTCSGGGGPTVILDADLNGDSSEFLSVVPLLSRAGRICAYDRIGEGASDAPPPGDRTTRDMVADLHMLIAAAGLATPVLLVGNHFGGLVDLRFAATYPSEVAGLVLLDPPIPSVYLRFNPSCQGQAATTRSNENVDLCETFWEAGHANLAIPDVPLVVLTRSDPQDFAPAEFAAWQASHRALASSVTHGRQQIVSSANVIPEDAPRDVVAAIDSVVAQIHQ
jgi:pimeloyl-ACP methyl ester carboxylesterase